MLICWPRAIHLNYASRSLSICSRQFGKSFMYIENSNGPRLDPCGTPHWIAFCSDFTLLGRQTCFLLFKYDLNSFWAGPFIPYCSSFRRRTQWSTVSNAFLKSKNRTPLIRPLSIFSSHWLGNVIELFLWSDVGESQIAVRK